MILMGNVKDLHGVRHYPNGARKYLVYWRLPSHNSSYQWLPQWIWQCHISQKSLHIFHERYERHEGMCPNIFQTEHILQYFCKPEEDDNGRGVHFEVLWKDGTRFKMCNMNEHKKIYKYVEPESNRVIIKCMCADWWMPTPGGVDELDDKIAPDPVGFIAEVPKRMSALVDESEYRNVLAQWPISVTRSSDKKDYKRADMVKLAQVYHEIMVDSLNLNSLHIGEANYQEALDRFFLSEHTELYFELLPFVEMFKGISSDKKKIDVAKKFLFNHWMFHSKNIENTVRYLFAKSFDDLKKDETNVIYFNFILKHGKRVMQLKANQVETPQWSEAKEWIVNKEANFVNEQREIAHNVWSIEERQYRIFRKECTIQKYNATDAVALQAHRVTRLTERCHECKRLLKYLTRISLSKFNPFELDDSVHDIFEMACVMRGIFMKEPKATARPDVDGVMPQEVQSSDEDEDSEMEDDDPMEVDEMQFPVSIQQSVNFNIFE